MKVIKNSIIVMVFVLFIAAHMGCGKDSTSTVTNPWGNCLNPVSKDVNFRLGLWVQNSLKDEGLAKIKFINDSILDIYVASSVQKWQTNIKYKFDSCNAFKYLKYWVPQPPNALDYDIYVTSYQKEKSEWYLIRKDRYPSTGQPAGWDTFVFKKQ